jgi:hypothetical protein
VSEIKVNSRSTNTTTHYAVIQDRDLERLIAGHVAAAAGVNLDGDGVRFQCHVRSSMGSSSMESKAEVTITVDHNQQPRCVEVES